MTQKIEYTTVMSSLFSTCTYRCGYCTIAETGAVMDAQQLKPYKDVAFIQKITDFFNRRTTDTKKWHLRLTGGEPLMMPNMPLFCENLFAKGNLVSMDTALFFKPDYPNFKYLMGCDVTKFEHMMASFHPEAEDEEDHFFEKIRLLKSVGHQVIVRFVGHPKRLDMMPRIHDRCKELDVTFYPTALLSTSYPHAYTPEEKQKLLNYTSSRSQLYLLEGSVETSNAVCNSGSTGFAIDFVSGSISPCILVPGFVMGNLHEDRIEVNSGPKKCPQAGIACNSDVHYQHNFVVGANDSDRFAEQKRGYVAPLTPEEIDNILTATFKKVLKFSTKRTNIGQVQDENALIFTRDFVRSQYDLWKAKYYPQQASNNDAQ